MNFLIGSLWAILIILLMIVISSLPLYLAVTFLGGRTSILKTFLVMLISGIIFVIVSGLIPFGGIIGFSLLIWVYREMFRLKWIKAFLAWILQIVFMILLGFVLALFGLGGLLLSYFTF